MGQNDRGEASQFRYLLERQYPDIKLDWSRIIEGIKADIHFLPDLYEYKEARL